LATRRPTESGHFESADGTRLYFEYDPVEAPRGALLFVHGFGEHCGRYASTVARFVGEGYSCYRFDYRGHGRADGRRGHMYRFDDYLADLAAFRTHVGARIGTTPQFLLAHSNGGLIGLHGVARDPKGLTGLVLSSPFFGIEVHVGAVKSAAGRLMSRLIPAFALPTDIDPSFVSHDPDVVEAYANDPLVTSVASARWFTETLKAHAAAPAAAERITLPVLHQQAGDDKVVSAEASERIHGHIASADKTWQSYEGFFHEIWFELERERPLAALSSWLTAHLPSTP
jgi:lysophospholipase